MGSFLKQFFFKVWWSLIYLVSPIRIVFLVSKLNNFWPTLKFSIFSQAFFFPLKVSLWLHLSPWFILNFLYKVGDLVPAFFPSYSVQLLQHHLLKRLSYSIELLLHLCQKSIEHICGGLFLDFLFYFFFFLLLIFVSTPLLRPHVLIMVTM